MRVSQTFSEGGVRVKPLSRPSSPWRGLTTVEFTAAGWREIEMAVLDISRSLGASAVRLAAMATPARRNRNALAFIEDWALWARAEHAAS